ncbi:MAG TPA: hypothetical protein VG166_01845 [Caulobacteraceae bacterium]|jgi:hypothetical protein|nr:hypothetical protein [Caulobacteraceae bacterium]
MKNSLSAGVAALVAGAALAATPAMAQFHGGGGHMAGGFHGGAGMRSGGFHGGAGMGSGGFHGGVRPGAFRSGAGTWSGHWRDHDRDHDRFFFFGGFFPGFGFYDPFWWDAGYVGGYAMDPYYDGYDGYAAPAPAAPSGYDCDGWRWDKAAGRYVAAKVSCD